jgi:hypothetical protein
LAISSPCVVAPEHGRKSPAGVCAFNGEAADFSHYRKCEQWDKEHARDLAKARKLWGM